MSRKKSRKINKKAEPQSSAPKGEIVEVKGEVVNDSEEKENGKMGKKFNWKKFGIIGGIVAAVIAVLGAIWFFLTGKKDDKYIDAGHDSEDTDDEYYDDEDPEDDEDEDDADEASEDDKTE